MRDRDRIREYIVDELLPSAASNGFNDDTPLLNGLLDSGALMRLVVFIEEELGVTVEDDDVSSEHFETLGHIERFVSAKRGPASS